MASQKKIILSGVAWRFAERFGAQLVSFIVSIVLARLLSPEDYGIIALITIFTSILNVFIDSGLGTALVQKKDADDLDFSSVFYFNILMCVLLYLGMFVCAPYISLFYKRPDLTPVIRVLSLTLIISGVKNVQQSYVSRNMLFKRFFFSTLGGTIGAAIIGIILAYKGYGVWALVAQQLFNSSMDTIILWITVKWKPIKACSFERFKTLFSFGWKMLLASIVSSIYSQLRQLIIGKFYSANDLAFYNQGEKVPNFVTCNINASIDSVLFPAMANEQDDRERIKNLTRRSIAISVYVLAPIMLGLAAVSNNLVLILLTPKWLPAVPYMCLFCLTYVFQPIHTCNLNAIKALGRSDLFLKLEIIKTILGIIIVILTARYGVWMICVGSFVSSIVSQIVNAWPNKKLLKYSYLEQLKDIIPTLVIALIMAIVVFFLGKYIENTVLAFIVQIIVGVIVYIGESILFHIDSFEYIIYFVKTLL